MLKENLRKDLNKRNITEKLIYNKIFTVWELQKFFKLEDC